MDSSTNPVSNPAGGFSDRGRSALSQVQRMTTQPAFRRALPAIIILAAAIMALVAYLFIAGPSRTALHTGLPESEKANALNTLTGAGVDAVLDTKTGVINVADADYHRARMLLAAAGLPQGVQDGYSVLSDLPMGTSRSVENARLRQMQELELARSISEFQSVSAARIHLALPEKTAFVRDTQPPRASIFLQVRSGYVVDASQVEAIVSLVSTSVPGMARSNVSVVDQNGRLLSTNSDDPATRLTNQQMKHQLELEQVYRRRIESLILPIIGLGNAAVQVSVEMDFTRTEVMEESVDPESIAVRSIQQSNQESSAPQARGVPGAVSNAAPAEAGLAATTTSIDIGESTSSSSSSTRNYEISRKVQNTQAPGVRIVRVNAAVLLARPNGTTADGNPITLSDELIADVERLTRSAISYNSRRGDLVTVSSQPFVNTIIDETPAWYTEPWVANLAKQAAQLIGLAIVILGVVRPILTRALFSASSSNGSSGMSGSFDPNWVEVSEGESLSDVRARLNDIGSEPIIQPTASYEEKVQLVQKFAAGESSHVASVFQNMIQNNEKEE